MLWTGVGVCLTPSFVYSGVASSTSNPSPNKRQGHASCSKLPRVVWFVRTSAWHSLFVKNVTDNTLWSRAFMHQYGPIPDCVNTTDLRRLLCSFMREDGHDLQDFIVPEDNTSFNQVPYAPWLPHTREFLRVCPHGDHPNGRCPPRPPS